MAPVNAPVAHAQADAMQRAFSLTGRVPQEVDYVELHATGEKRDACISIMFITPLHRNGTGRPYGSELGRRALPERRRAPRW